VGVVKKAMQDLNLLMVFGDNLKPKQIADSEDHIINTTFKKTYAFRHTDIISCFVTLASNPSIGSISQLHPFCTNAPHNNHAYFRYEQFDIVPMVATQLSVPALLPLFLCLMHFQTSTFLRSCNALLNYFEGPAKLLKFSNHPCFQFNAPHCPAHASLSNVCMSYRTYLPTIYTLLAVL
jgi:hypothetical protein